MTFGPRDQMLSAGKARVEELKTAGFSKAELYGETQMGGMHSLFVAKYGFEAHGLIRDPKIPDSVQLFGAMKPIVGLGALALAAGLGISFITGLGYKVSDQDKLAEPKKEEE
jgi:formate dehydrogenase iron-sulfur subunit